MFDIDGTLVDSEPFDSMLYTEAIQEILNIERSHDWSAYKHVTDSGILSELLDELGFSENKLDLMEQTKKLFISKVNEYLQGNPMHQITGAGDFLDYLLNRNDVQVAIATGGWRETAELKLKKGGFTLEKLQITSANDHYSRTRIMEIAETRTNISEFKTRTYFGDARWDKNACDTLGYNFVLVGSNFQHDQRIDDFRSHSDALRYIGL